MSASENLDPSEEISGPRIAGHAELPEFVSRIPNLGLKVNYKIPDLTLGEVVAVVTTPDEVPKCCRIQQKVTQLAHIPESISLFFQLRQPTVMSDLKLMSKNRLECGKLRMFQFHEFAPPRLWPPK